MRRVVTFTCAGETLVGTVDPAVGETGLLIVSGGNEIRAGAHRGMTQIAAWLANGGIPVFRYDRRGVGDSTGANHGFLGSRPDIDAAISAFRHAVPHMKRIIGFGVCDGATTLILFGAALDKIILANPWLADEPDGLPSGDAIRAHYLDRIKEPSTWARALSGGVSFRRFASGLSKIAAAETDAIGEVERSVIDALKKRPGAIIVIASGDATGITFAAAASRAELPQKLHYIDTESHSFARTGDQLALLDLIRRTIAA
ncbi:MAG: hydrolase 1, exosortase A system-associated [Sphingomonas sp.]|nr:hydrolase 1, exosortase A system-associated [Sphingomonas sp.]